jgi:hypothetical protein
MDGCQVFIKEEMDDHNDTKDWDSSSPCVPLALPYLALIHCLASPDIPLLISLFLFQAHPICNEKSKYHTFIRRFLLPEHALQGLAQFLSLSAVQGIGEILCFRSRFWI